MSIRGLAVRGGTGISTVPAVGRGVVLRCKVGRVPTSRGMRVSVVLAMAACRGVVTVIAKSGAAVRRAVTLGLTTFAPLKTASRRRRPLVAVSRLASSGRFIDSHLDGGQESVCNPVSIGGRLKLADSGVRGAGHCLQAKGEGRETSGCGLRVVLRSHQIRPRREVVSVPTHAAALIMPTDGRVTALAKVLPRIALFRVAPLCAAMSPAQVRNAIQVPVPGSPVGAPVKNGPTTVLATACSAVASVSNFVMQPSSP